MTSSSTSMIDSISESLISAGSTSAPWTSSGTASVLATPRNSAPWPSGTFSSTQALPNSSWIARQQAGEVDVVGVHLVDDDHAAQAGLAGLVEHPPGVDLDARLGVDHDHGRIDAPQGADRLADEVGVARAYRWRGTCLPPWSKWTSVGLDRVLVLLLFLIEVADAGAVVDAGRAVDRAGGRQQACRPGSSCRPIRVHRTLRCGCLRHSISAWKPSSK